MPRPRHAAASALRRGRIDPPALILWLIVSMLILSPCGASDSDPLRLDARRRMPSNPAAVRSILPRAGNGAGAIYTADLLQDMTFDDPDGGSWKQGWDLEVDLAQPFAGDADAGAPSSTPPLLHVHVVPFSHCDPGWVQTYDAYYETQTRHILDTVVDALGADPQLRFVWAEVSFFSRWWEDQRTGERRRQLAKTLAQEGRLEFVTGGWVMNDEAAVPYSASVLQLTVGHEWLRTHVGVEQQARPTHGWSIDPFGHSPTMALLNKKAGFEGMAINRINYRVRKELDWHRNGEFMWRPTWRGYEDSTDDIFTHLFPFFIYDIPHTCGPDPSVCSLYDFHKSATPWGGRPRAVSDANIKQQADALVDQWKKKASLFRTRHVMVPLGDDFRYASQAEGNALFGNHGKLHDYINAHSQEYGVTVAWSTFREYASSVTAVPVRERWPVLAPEVAPSDISIPSFPVVRGDFFPFCDVRQECWSGYYATRPFHKELSRSTEATLHLADVLLSTLAWKRLQQESLGSLFEGHLARLISARQTVSLFLHHDGITGTSKSFVMQDYASALQTARESSLSAAAFAIQNLFASEGLQLEVERLPLEQSPRHAESDLLPLPFVDIFALHTACQADGLCELPVIVANPTERRRSDVVFVRLSCEQMEPSLCFGALASVQVRSPAGNILPSQTMPVWLAKDTDISSQRKDDFVYQIRQPSPVLYDVAVAVDGLPALGANVILFTLNPGGAVGQSSSIATVSMHGTNLPDSSFVGVPVDVVQSASSGVKFGTKQDYLEFDARGLLAAATKMTNHGPVRVDITERYLFYRTQKSGAYIFVPQGEAVEVLEHGRTVLFVVVRGPVMDEILTDAGEGVIRRLRFLHPQKDSGFAPAPQVSHFVSLLSSSSNNRELVVRYRTSLDTVSGFSQASNEPLDKERPSFITDLNGMSFQKRRSRSSLARQANFYPATSAVFLEDEVLTANSVRFGVALSSTAAVSAQCNGCVELMLDRRVLADDNKGLGEGVTDNLRVHLRSSLLLERVMQERKTDNAAWWPTQASRAAMRVLDRPSILFVGSRPTSRGAVSTSSSSQVSFMEKSDALPEGIELIGMRLRQDSTWIRPQILLQFFYHPTAESDAVGFGSQNLSLSLSSSIGSSDRWDLEERTLTLLHSAPSSAALMPGEFASFVAHPRGTSMHRNQHFQAPPEALRETTRGKLRTFKLPQNLGGAKSRSHSEIFAITLFAIGTLLSPILFAAKRAKLASLVALTCLAGSFLHWLLAHE